MSCVHSVLSTIPRVFEAPADTKGDVMTASYHRTVLMGKNSPLAAVGPLSTKTMTLLA